MAVPGNTDAMPQQNIIKLVVQNLPYFFKTSTDPIGFYFCFDKITMRSHVYLLCRKDVPKKGIWNEQYFQKRRKPPIYVFLVSRRKCTCSTYST